MFRNVGTWLEPPALADAARRVCEGVALKMGDVEESRSLERGFRQNEMSGLSNLLKSRPIRLVAAAAVWCAGWAAHAVATGPGITGSAASTFLSSIICAGGAFLSVWLLLKARFRPYEAAGLLAFGVAANLAAGVLFSGIAARLVTGFSLIVGGYAAGALLARAVESARYIVPICMVGALADVWSVLAGPSRRIIASGNVSVIRHMFVSFPAPGAAGIQPVAGLADLVFVALFLCLALRLGLNVRRSAVAMFAGLVVGLAVAAVFSGAPGVPFIAGAFAVANWKSIRPRRSEIVHTLLFIAVMLAIFAIISVIH